MRHRACASRPTRCGSRAALVTPVQEVLIDTIKPLGKCLHEHGISQSKQCRSYLLGQVLRLSFHHRPLLLDNTMYVASLMEGVNDAATKGR